ncbi:MAG: TrbI/VirB10 family protein [Denitromonas halophila]|nr:MAG: TrbI/VirB10 family protein [Denitromonas halophila]
MSVGRGNDVSGLRPGEILDDESGEILTGRSETTNETSHAIGEERDIPSVNRSRSMRARMTNWMAVALMCLLGAGFLVWYYSTQFSRIADEEAKAKETAAARAGGEMILPPLGRINPPVAPAPPAASLVEAESPLFEPPPPPQATMTAAPAAQQGPKVPTPAELAHQRRLSAPVQAGSGAAGTAAAVVPASFDGATGQPGSNSRLAAMLMPTPTPAVIAKVLPTLRYLLPKGDSIDCTNITAIDSTYDGIVTCVGATDVYSADGSLVLLERGTKYVGEKKGDIKRGQGRVFVLWNEARTPTGVVVDLSSPGSDELGRTGLPGFVDTHFWDRFGAALLISVIDGTIQALANSQSDSSGTNISFDSNGSRDVMTEILKDTVSIPPTVIKNQGERIQIMVARDVDFRSVYELRRR